jgi:hypothetical protein
MNWTCILCLAALAASAVSADELHLRDGTVIVGSYIGGSQKEVWFQRTPAGAEVFPLFTVESLRFNSVPNLAPGAARSLPPAANPQARGFDGWAVEKWADIWTNRVKWAFALFFPPPLTAQLAHPAH